MARVSLLVCCCLTTLVWYSSPVSGFTPLATTASRSCHARWCPASRTQTMRVPTTLSYGEKLGVDPQLIFDTWEWTANLGAPAALVAGAVLATMVDTRQDMAPHARDSTTLKIFKKLCRYMLLTSFGLEIISIFVTTVTGTMLLSHGDAKVLKSFKYASPMGFLQHNWEFEYLTARIAFLQGLFHWLAAVALELLIPKPGEGKAARRMNYFTASSLGTILVAMLSFLNRHMTFYDNYFHMWRNYMGVCFRQFIWPIRPLTAVLLPMMGLTIFFGVRAFAFVGVEEEDEDKKERNTI